MSQELILTWVVPRNTQLRYASRQPDLVVLLMVLCFFLFRVVWVQLYWKVQKTLKKYWQLWLKAFLFQWPAKSDFFQKCVNLIIVFSISWITFVQTNHVFCFQLQDTIKLVKMIETTGVVAIGVHGRRKEERPRHAVRVDEIKAVTEAVSIPVIAKWAC